MRRLRQCNNGLALSSRGLPLVIPGVGRLGTVVPSAAAELAAFPDVFRVGDGLVELVGASAVSVEERTRAVHGVMEQLRREDRIPMLRGWRDEPWPVKADFDAPVELVVERSAAPLLGVKGFGCHVNGLVAPERGHGEGWRIWVARRASTKQTYPGKLDHIVAGGLGHGENPGDNVVRESFEEASIPTALATSARPAGFVEYCQQDPAGFGISPDVIFCYDLELPADFVPAANDGEVESFSLWSVPDVIKSLATDNDDWKPNVAVVVIDMLVRRGFLKPEDKGLVELVRLLRAPGCNATPP